MEMDIRLEQFVGKKFNAVIASNNNWKDTFIVIAYQF